MNNPIPYTDYLYIKPTETKLGLSTTLQTYGEVLAIGPLVIDTKVGDIVAFELWDKAEFRLNDENCHFIRESDVICKLIP